MRASGDSQHIPSDHLESEAHLNLLHSAKLGLPHSADALAPAEHPFDLVAAGAGHALDIALARSRALVELRSLALCSGMRDHSEFLHSADEPCLVVVSVRDNLRTGFCTLGGHLSVIIEKCTT